MQEFPILDSLKRYSSGADLSPLADNTAQSTAFVSLMEHQSALMDASRDVATTAPRPQTSQTAEQLYSSAETVEDRVHSAVTVVERTASETGRRVAKGAEYVDSQTESRIRDAAQEARRAETERSRPVTAEDLQKMADGLRQWGLSDKELQDLKNRVNSDEGLTWGQLVNSLTQKMKAMHATLEFSATDKQQLMGFFQKAGFNPEEATTLIGDLAKGRQSEVLDAVLNRLKLQPAGKNPDISPEEAGTFLRALRLPDDKVANLKSLLTGAGSPATLGNALAALRGEVQDAKDGQLRALVQATFQQAKESDKDFDADEVMEKATKFSTDTKSTVDVLARHKTEAHQDLGKQDDDSDASAWREFFQKLRDETSADGKSSKTTSLESAREAFAASLRSQSGGRTGTPQATARQVLSQVRDGVVRNMADGTKQLRINLHPEDLGSLNLTLQVRDGEVKAIIRADNHETAKLLSEQVDALRRTLQDQGLKVAKVEVQTGLSGENQMNWQGAENHNDAQQREAAEQFMWRRRMMNGGGGGDVLAQEVLSTGTEANLAGTGLHLIA